MFSDYNRKARRSGKLSMTKQTNVSYEIKNGQPVFHLRRSPRKCYLNDERTPINRHTPKLFTPSGNEDYLTGSSPARKRFRPAVPSPIKFADNMEQDDGLNDSVKNIIDNLDQGNEIRILDHSKKKVLKTFLLFLHNIGKLVQCVQRTLRSSGIEVVLF